MKDFIEETAADDALQGDFPGPRAAAIEDFEAAAGCFAAQGLKTPRPRAGACDVPHRFGQKASHLKWSRLAKAAPTGTAIGKDIVFCQAKLETARYHTACELPAARIRRARIETGARPVLSLAPEAF
ncbi:MAG TPA: hypothetical protein DIU07_02000 [Rhodobacteraceae bacterium]|nr:hypothetical protein [Paracoccaceae bacterium]